MDNTRNNRPTKRGFPFPGDDDARRRLVTSADAHGNREEEEMPPVKRTRHQSNKATDVVNELFSPESIHSSSPLGLNLTKSPCFLELIQKKLALVAKGRIKEVTEDVACRGAIRSKYTVAEEMKPSQKLQASSFQASVLTIGDWEWKSRYQGDLVAKFYFANRKVVWEMLVKGLKSKIEIKFSEICALRISCPKDLPGTLDITVSGEPQFFRETTPRPYKCTSWHVTTDFTGGRAGNLRHILECDSGIMDKHIANLLSEDHRLYLLSQENTINPESSFGGTCRSVPEIPSSWSNGNSYGSDDDDNLVGTEQSGESFPLHPMPMGTTAVGVNHSGALQGVLFPSSGVAGTSVITEEPSGGSDQLKGNKFNWKNFFEKTAVVQQPFMSSAIINGKGNHINNLINSENSKSRLNYSWPPPQVIRTFPGDSMTNGQVEPRSQSSHADHAVLYPSSEEPSVPRAPLKKNMLDWKSIFETPPETQPSSASNAGIMNSVFNHNADYSSLPGEMTTWRTNQPSYNQQGVPQCDMDGSPAIPQNLPSNGNIAPDRLALEQISQSLLRDDEVVNAAGEENLLSTVNSFSCLIGQAPAPLQSPHSQASNTLAAPPAAAEPTEVIEVHASESSGADDWILPRMESPRLSWELSPEDMAELLP
uniref:Uncharacterized protein n=1 Tax=Avena sativa TaxID=4498 RepID=A0ACD5UQZ6_AVESA